jgi:hypothetical protein
MGIVAILVAFASVYDNGTNSAQQTALVNERGRSNAGQCQTAPQPVQGIYEDFSDRPIAPLTIRTSYGSNYFIKLVDADTGALIQSAFIYGGLTFETKVPVGDIVLKYATGRYWCGGRALFGPETSFYKADRVLRFSQRQTLDGVVTAGHIVELISRRNGNLSTTGIDRRSF